MKENKSNGLEPIIAQAIEEMKSEQGNNFSLERINLAELERRTGISRAKLRRLKANNFNQKAHGLIGQKQQTTVLSGYSAYLDKLLRQGITNSAVCLDRLREFGFEGSLSTVKRYIKAHKHLVPTKRQLVAPQGNRSRRFTTEPGESYHHCETLLEEMVALKAADYSKYQKRMKKTCGTALLILDDFLLHTITDEREVKVLFEILEKRSEINLSTIICSQREPASWSSMILNDEVSSNAIMKRATRHYTVVIKPLNNG